MRRVSVFGSTGSIGVNTLDLLSRDAAAYEIVALTGGRNIKLLAQQARAFGAKVAVTCFPDRLSDLKEALAGTETEAAAGPEAIAEAATRPADWIMSAIVGTDGLIPSLAAAAQGSTLALANKESLVCAGSLLMDTAKRAGATILPVDSEHSAVFQALVGEEMSAVERVIITASGGAFRDWPIEKLISATPEQAAQHPNWSMGMRITIDSASMFNKALEVIEVKEYFGVTPDQIEVLVHPESLIHAMVGFRDGALMAHLGAPDMRHAIGYALHHPNRAELPVARLDLAKVSQLNFTAPDPARFPALALAGDVMEIGGLAGAAFNAAKDHALDAFIARKIAFTDMAKVVAEVLNQLSRENSLTKTAITLDLVREMDIFARNVSEAVILKTAF
ncbi:1-deoxy-D-xylulose 5-phosphate reductoisomerase [Actibacterium mucosum KCTC 23349]|uniref:1-deoxy-D-xylulose 5-phosphate reductoisomerase n=1 Tax=Actibacterium mucosum KCTC 23349 TaxID=1454373 RepID=A0A037ZML1_9RHOB|nr:1-deoxy-D-xylulose-5-phosphate reductoisomerase [Actibacterium mucosum]KAJ56875.1 1-deoxy-D-xylulose 5-phosphate reductoisomerase [Actibacterium mucosum KCTC 23349]